MKTIVLIVLLFAALVGNTAVLWTNVGSTSSGWIQVPQNTGAGPATNLTAITISAWTMRQLDRGSTRATLIGQGRTLPSPIDPIYEIHLLTNHYRFQYHSPGVVHVWAVTGTAPNTNVPAHIALTYTYGTAGSIKFFVDGVSQAGSWITGSGTGPSTNNAQSLMIGGDGFGSPFMGLISEVAIWNSALSDQEIMMLATSKIKYLPISISPSTLLVYLPMDRHTLFFNGLDTRMNDMSKGPKFWHGSFEGFGDLCAFPEQFYSYPPNE